jgi:RNA-splicing ligase RtcB
MAAMNLAGDYASACHHVIHQKIAMQLGRKPLKMVENHHNFAWKEIHEGRELIVHRKVQRQPERCVGNYSWFNDSSRFHCER